MSTLTFTRKIISRDWIGEVYLIISVLGYWGIAKALVNPIAIVLLSILALLIWRKNAILGWIIGMTFLLLNLYMAAALLNEFAEFPEFNNRAMEFIFGGSLYLGCNIFVSVLLLIKWGRRLG